MVTVLLCFCDMHTCGQPPPIRAACPTPWGSCVTLKSCPGHPCCSSQLPAALRCVSLGTFDSRCGCGCVRPVHLRDLSLGTGVLKPGWTCDFRVSPDSLQCRARQSTIRHGCHLAFSSGRRRGHVFVCSRAASPFSQSLPVSGHILSGITRLSLEVLTDTNCRYFPSAVGLSVILWILFHVKFFSF